MQIVETTSFGVRAVVMTLGRDGDTTRFRLFPMIHIAEPDFYQQIATRASGCDLILAEGIRHREASVLTWSYRLVAGARRLGVVSQQSFDWSGLGPKMISGDLDPSSFARGWRAVPLLQRALGLVLFPIAGLIFRLIGTREQLARVMAVELLPDRDDILRPEQVAAIDALIRDVRDRALIAATDKAAAGGAALVGVMFGARHMRALLRHLLGSGYRILGTEFVTVMSL